MTGYAALIELIKVIYERTMGQPFWTIADHLNARAGTFLATLAPDMFLPVYAVLGAVLVWCDFAADRRAKSGTNASRKVRFSLSRVMKAVVLILLPVVILAQVVWLVWYFCR